MVFKCKMCDATLTFHTGDSVAVCEYCGTAQTLPKYEDERIGNLYNRAEHYRKNNEYDKAQALYEQILDENPEDADSYWSVVLCKYGVEYVEEAGSNKRVPTVNRTQYTSIFDDENYKAAIQYANDEQRAVYEEEAKRLNEIQKGILEISKKEEPFDIFICYKETDENGRRTLDSVLAADLHEILEKQGYKVFYARVTLDDKFGEAYEPYIFAALQSSRVMIVVGTKPEHFQAVWVKNEWSRYLGLIKNGAKKTLIPAYKDMDPYQMPMEFAHLQAINMGELGFQQDLISGIRKLLAQDSEADHSGKVSSSVNVASVLERGFLYAEDKLWKEADECFERALNADPGNADAYLGKLLVDLEVSTKEGLISSDQLFEMNPYYLKIMRFGSEDQIAYVQRAAEESGIKVKGQLYKDTVWKLNNSILPNQLLECQKTFESLGSYLDSREKAEEAKQRAEDARIKQLEEQYIICKELMEKNDIDSCKRALNFFSANRTYKDCYIWEGRCKENYDALVAEKDAETDRALRNAHLMEGNYKYDDSLLHKMDHIGNWIKLGSVAFCGIIFLLGALLKSCS